MSELKSAYQEGFSAQLRKRPILTTLIVGGIGYFVFKKFGGALSEAVQESRMDTAKTSGGATSNVSPFIYTAFWNYWRTGKRLPQGYLILSQPSLNSVVINIYDAMGYISDDEDVVIAQIKRCSSKVQIAQVSEAFTIRYKRDFLEFLKEGDGVRWKAGLDKDKLDEVLRYVNSLPTYTIKK